EPKFLRAHGHLYDIFTPEHRSYATHSANISSSTAIESNNPNSRYHFGSSVQTNFLNLQFSELKIGDTNHPRPLLPQLIQFETDLSRYFSFSSRLFRAGGDPASVAVISPEGPLPYPNSPLPSPVI